MELGFRVCKNDILFIGYSSFFQACHYRMCAWKNPSGKRIAPGAAPTQAPPVVPPVIPPPRKIKQEKNVKQEVASPASTGKGTPKRGRQSISVISPAPSKVNRSSHHKGKAWPKWVSKNIFLQSFKCFAEQYLAE